MVSAYDMCDTITYQIYPKKPIRRQRELGVFSICCPGGRVYPWEDGFFFFFFLSCRSVVSPIFLMRHDIIDCHVPGLTLDAALRKERKTWRHQSAVWWRLSRFDKSLDSRVFVLLMMLTGFWFMPFWSSTVLVAKCTGGMFVLGRGHKKFSHR